MDNFDVFHVYDENGDILSFCFCAKTKAITQIYKLAALSNCILEFIGLTEYFYFIMDKKRLNIHIFNRKMQKIGKIKCPNNTLHACMHQGIIIFLDDQKLLQKWEIKPIPG